MDVVAVIAPAGNARVCRGTGHGSTWLGKEKKKKKELAGREMYGVDCES